MWNNLWTDTLNGKTGAGEFGGHFICSEYNNRADLATNEIDSWERDHSCNTGKIAANEKY